MTDSQLTLGATAPGGFIAIPDGLVVELETKIQLSDEARAACLEAKRACVIHGLSGINRAMRLRDAKAALGEGNGSGQNGWDSICRSDFDTNACDANNEIRGLEAFEAAFANKSGHGQAMSTIPAEVGSTHLNEVGRVSDLKSRLRLAELVRDAEVRLNKRALRAAAKDLKSEAGKVKLKATAPPKAPSAPRLPTPGKPTAGGKPMSISKWTAKGTPQGARMDQELNYLGGEEAGNASFAEGLKKLRKNSSRSGKLARIQALALALHAECKSVSDRYQLESEKTGRDWNRYMTLWQHHWADTDQLDMAQLLKQIASEMAEASRHLEITGMLSWSDDVQLEI